MQSFFKLFFRQSTRQIHSLQFSNVFIYSYWKYCEQSVQQACGRELDDR